MNGNVPDNVSVTKTTKGTKDRGFTDYQRDEKTFYNQRRGNYEKEDY